MFGMTRPAQIALPSDRSLHALTVEAIVLYDPVVKSMGKKLRMPVAVFEKARDAWAAYRGPVKNTAKFEIELPHHDSREGFVVVIVRYRGKTDLGFRLFDEDGLLVTELFSRDAAEPVEGSEDTAFLDSLWTRLIPVETIRNTGAQLGLNSRCSCGSGKKFKKCCGRFS